MIERVHSTVGFHAVCIGIVVEDQLEDNLLIIHLSIVIVTKQYLILITEIVGRRATADQGITIETFLCRIGVGDTTYDTSSIR